MPREWSWIRDPNNWYWFIGADRSQVYSSATGGFVSTLDSPPNEALSSFLAAGLSPAIIDTVESLGAVLSDLAAPPPVDAAVLSAYKDADLTKVDQVIFRVLFIHENRIRALNSQPAISAQQFLAAIKALL